MGTSMALLLYAAVGVPRPSAGTYIYTQATRYDLGSAVRAGDRFPDGAVLMLVANGAPRQLAPGFAASAYASVSFDGARILFAGKQKKGDPWQIWEIALAGGAPKRITTFADDAIAPLYISTERIVYAARTASGYQLETAQRNGSEPERITFGPGDHIPTAVLRDGRVLFDAPHPGAGRDLYTVYPDGSGVESYRCDHGRDRHSGAQLSSGDIVFESGGRLARFNSAQASQLDLPATKGEFTGRVAELAGGDWLVSYRADPAQPFGIYRWRPGRGSPERISAAGNFYAVDPVVVRPGDVPKRHPSALGNRDGANLLCLNVHVSRSPIPSTPVTSVRVWAIDDAGEAVALGQAPVASDGSFFVQTPSERAIRFELLDRAGKTVVAEEGWFWARQGEQRVCVGCHAGPEHSPENATPAILLNHPEPAKLMPQPRAAQGVSR
jgi:hypothetical protein